MHVSNVVTIEGACRRAHYSRRAITCAIKRGELSVYPTACGRAQLLSIADVDRWARQVRKTGPKPKSKKGANRGVK